MFRVLVHLSSEHTGLPHYCNVQGVRDPAHSTSSSAVGLSHGQRQKGKKETIIDHIIQQTGESVNLLPFFELLPKRNFTLK